MRYISDLGQMLETGTLYDYALALFQQESEKGNPLPEKSLHDIQRMTEGANIPPFSIVVLSDRVAISYMISSGLEHVMIECNSDRRYVLNLMKLDRWKGEDIPILVNYHDLAGHNMADAFSTEFNADKIKIFNEMLSSTVYRNVHTYPDLPEGIILETLRFLKESA